MARTLCKGGMERSCPQQGAATCLHNATVVRFLGTAAYATC